MRAALGNVAITVLAFLFAPRKRPKSWREW